MPGRRKEQQQLLLKSEAQVLPPKDNGDNSSSTIKHWSACYRTCSKKPHAAGKVVGCLSVLPASTPVVAASSA